MTTKITIDFDTLRLGKGAHAGPSRGLCVMEAVAYFRGLPHTDAPPCVSKVITHFLMSWNDALDDDARQMLKPYILRVPGTATTPEDEERRAWLATDWLVRTFAPAWLDLAGLTEHAANLRALPALTTDELAAAAQGIISAADSAARSAAYSAAYSAAVSAADSAADSAAVSAADSAAYSAAGSAAYLAARSAAYSAARSAAYSAAYSAADSAAVSAAVSAARSAAYSAARSAAYSAAYSALAPTVALLQQSALGLLDRMIAVGKVEVAV